MNITLNNNSNTKTIIENLKKLKFEEIKIDIRNNLSFIDIKLGNYLVIFSNFLFKENENLVEHYGICIFNKDNFNDEIKIKFGDLNMVGSF